MMDFLEMSANLQVPTVNTDACSGLHFRMDLPVTVQARYSLESGV